MQKGIEKLAQDLTLLVNTSTSLKKTSIILESLSHSSTFKAKAKEIAGNTRLSNNSKRKKMALLFATIEYPLLANYFDRVFENGDFWLFSSKQFDYFDQFVQAFQLETEKLLLVNLITAIEITPQEAFEISKDLSQAFEKKVILNCKLDPKIFGGARISLGNLVFDYTLKSKFQQFQRQWLTRMAKTAEFVGE